MTAPNPLAQALGLDIADLLQRIEVLERAQQLGSSTIAVGDDDAVPLVDIVADSADQAVYAADLDERLALAEDAVAAASEAADAAKEAGEAAGEEGRAAAEEAAAAADEALEAAKNAGGGNGYQDRPPTADDQTNPVSGLPFVDGAFWFIRASTTGIVTGAYQFQKPDPAAPGAWVQVTLNNEVIGNLDAGKINTGYLSAARIAADTITAAMIAVDAILARNIKAGQITTEALAAAVVTAEKILAATITGDKLAANTITAREILAGSITADKLVANAIDGKTITGALIRTAASGGRVEVVQNKNSTGDPYKRGAIQFIDDSGNIAKLSPGAFGSSGALTLAVGSNDASGNFSGETTVAFGTAPGIPDVYPGIGAALPSPPRTMWVDTRAANITAGAVGSMNSQRTGRLLIYDGLWITPSLSNADQDGTTPFRYRLYNGMVVFDGLVGLNSNSIGATIFNLPPGYRPAVAREYPVNRGTGGSATLFTVRIQAGGNVATLGPSGGSGTLQMADITPFIADN